MQESKKDLVVSGDHGLANYEKLGLKFDPRDLVVPKILCMQGLSTLVSEGKAVMGEIRDSMNGKKLGDSKEALEIIPFHVNKTWVIFEEINGKLQYKEQVPQTAENFNWPWEDMVNGVKVRRDQSINYFVLLPWEIKEEIYFPYMISFRRTSYLAGKKLETARVKYGAFSKPVFVKTFNLHAVRKENELGKFYIFDITENRKTTDEEIKAVERWKSVIESTNIRVDDSDLEKEASEMNQTSRNVGEYKEGDEF